MPTVATPDGEPRPGRPEGRLTRPRDGRWLAGVCAGLARYSGRRVATVRLAFVLSTPFFGISLVAYLACWFILPSEGARVRTRGSALSSGLVSVLLGFGGGLALLTLAAAGAVATIFGLGWGVVVVAAGTLVTGVFWMREANPGWILLPLAALVLPAAVIAALNFQLDRQIGVVSLTPRDQYELADGEYRIGLGTLFIDLREYDWAAGPPPPLFIDSGLGRAIVALPPDRCVGVKVRYDTRDGLADGIADALGVAGDGSSALALFGRSYASGQGEVSRFARGKHPTLSIHFSSQGGELHVRDYPDSIDPREWSDWPGVPYYLYPDKVPPKVRASADYRYSRKIEREIPGPCSHAGRR